MTERPRPNLDRVREAMRERDDEIEPEPAQQETPEEADEGDEGDDGDT